MKTTAMALCALMMLGACSTPKSNNLTLANNLTLDWDYIDYQQFAQTTDTIQATNLGLGYR